MPRRALAGLLVLAACSGLHPLPPPPANVAMLAVAPVENKTGDGLAIAGDTFIGKMIGRQKRTVPDEIARELEARLRELGFGVGGSGVPRLKIVLQRFAADLPQLGYVDVTLTASLVDVDGSVRWSGERTGWIVPTLGAVSLEDAYETAARTVARQLVDGWQPAI